MNIQECEKCKRYFIGALCGCILGNAIFSWKVGSPINLPNGLDGMARVAMGSSASISAAGLPVFVPVAEDGIVPQRMVTFSNADGVETKADKEL